MDPVLALVARTGLALLLAVAAFHKARDPSGFRETLRDYRLLPDAAVSAAARLLVGAEVALAVCFAAGFAPTATALAGAALFALYTAAIAVNLARGRRHIDCGCLGPARRQSLSGWLLARNAALVAAALATAVPVAPRALVWVDALTLVAGVGVLALLWSAANRLADDWPTLPRADAAP